MEQQEMRKTQWKSARSMAYIGLCAALMAVCAWICIPATVPFTMQTFAVLLGCGLLGGKRGAAAVLVYLLLGAAGLPVFSGFRGGLGVLLGTTGGYLIGFLATALVMWALERAARRNALLLALSMGLGLLVCYAFGTAWFLVVYARNSGAIGLSAALSMCVAPYLLPDAAKLLLAVFLTGRLRRALRL